MIELASKTRKERKEKGSIQDYMAIQMNISQKTYGRIENGKSKIDERLTIIADILEIDPIELLKPDKTNVFNYHSQQGGNAANVFIKKSVTEKEWKNFTNRINRLEEVTAEIKLLLQRTN